MLVDTVPFKVAVQNFQLYIFGSSEERLLAFVNSQIHTWNDTVKSGAFRSPNHSFTGSLM